MEINYISSHLHRITSYQNVCGLEIVCIYVYANILQTIKVHLYEGFMVNASHVLWCLEHNLYITSNLQLNDEWDTIVFSIIVFSLQHSIHKTLFLCLLLFFPSPFTNNCTYYIVPWLLLSLSLLCVTVTRHINLMVSRKLYCFSFGFHTLNGYA